MLVYIRVARVTRSISGDRRANARLRRVIAFGVCGRSKKGFLSVRAAVERNVNGGKTDSTRAAMFPKLIVRNTLSLDSRD